MKGGRGSYQDLFNTRQYHCETASTAFLGLEFDASSHLFDNEHTDGQAQPDALGKLAALVETLENHLLLAVRNAYAGVFHIKMYLAHAGRTAIPQPDAASFRKLVGIVQEVGEYLCQSHGVYIHLHIFGRESLRNCNGGRISRLCV